MRHIVSLVTHLAVLIATTTMTSAGNVASIGPNNGSPPPRYSSDRILVKFVPGAPGKAISALHGQAEASPLRMIPGIDVHVVQVPAGKVLERLELYKRNPNVLFAEPDFYRVLYIPNEGDEPEPEGTGNEYFIEQWALHNTGQLHTQPDPLLGSIAVQGAEDADIDAPEGWEISTGNPGVKIAILDTGIDCRSGDNPAGSLEFAMPGKCVEQISFVTDYSTTLEDVVAHGTHVAGIAAAETDNDIGTAGVGFNSSVGSLKTCFEYTYDLLPPIGYYVIVGVCPVSSSADAILYAADNGYQVINMSYASDIVDENGEPAGVGGWSETESSAVDYAWSKGVVLVAAAGNDNNTVKTYPAAYDNVIAVGATDHYDDRASFSTFGDWVSLLAPGDNIISTVPNELCVFYADLFGLTFDAEIDACLDWYSGTSMASPHVAGAAALVWGHLFEDTAPAGCTDVLSGESCNAVVRQRLENGADAAGALGQNMLAWSQHGRLNLLGALTVEEPPPPPPPPTELPPSAPSDVTATNQADGTALVAWNDTSSNEDGFEIERETQHPKNGKWVDNTVLTSNPNTVSYVDAVGIGTHHYRIRSYNEAGDSNWSEWVEVTVTDNSGGGGEKPCRGKKCP